MSELLDGERANLRRNTEWKQRRGLTAIQLISEAARREIRWEAKCREWIANGVEPGDKEATR